MEVIVVTKYYCNWDDSYSKILGVCMTNDKADELINSDINIDEHPKMPRSTWFDIKDKFREFRENLIKNEINCPKKGGFLGRFHYDGLNKYAKAAYDKLKAKYDGYKYDHELDFDMEDEEYYYLHLIFEPRLKGISYEEYEEINDWYHKHYENPENIHYSKDKFEVQ